MKDLLVYCADADAQAFMQALLNKPQALGIRPITFHVDRHPQHDSGMVQSGAELVREQKGRYLKSLLMWDHHGSGRDHKQSPLQVQREIQDKLNAYSWKDNSAVTLLVPELEEWLWFCENAIATYYQITINQLVRWVEDRASILGMASATLKREQPKELFEHIVRKRIKRTISPSDFAAIGTLAGIGGLQGCASFSSVVCILHTWFPPIAK